MRLFVDTWGWITLENKREVRHAGVKAFYEHFRQQAGRSYTTDYVLDETITMTFQRTPFETARTFLHWLDTAIAQGYLQLERITPERFDNAKQLRLKYSDKPKISFTDFTSMVVMYELGITDILTEDDHFIQVGMGFRKVPG